ncbi:MAG TPA: MauE/DoxX family redox-associated membrane protein [Acidimicrobiales bacterium]|nr:MauE/DoxX family redox-associated membrane protein [Acidimicrobiales bacterium]
MAAFGVYLIACVLLVGAGAAKVVKPADTARAIAGVAPGGFRLWRIAVRAGAAVELAAGVAGIASPGPEVAAFVAASYAAFAAFVVVARAGGGALATCGCFGEPDTPPTVTHAALNGVLAAAAVAVAATWHAPSLGAYLSHTYRDGVPLLAASALGAWFAYLVMAPLARLQGLRQLEPYVPGGRT